MLVKHILWMSGSSTLRFTTWTGLLGPPGTCAAQQYEMEIIKKTTYLEPKVVFDNLNNHYTHAHDNRERIVNVLMCS